MGANQVGRTGKRGDGGMERRGVRKMNPLNPLTGTDSFNPAPMNSTDPDPGRRVFFAGLRHDWRWLAVTPLSCHSPTP